MAEKQSPTPSKRKKCLRVHAPETKPQARRYRGQSLLCAALGPLEFLKPLVPRSQAATEEQLLKEAAELGLLSDDDEPELREDKSKKETKK